MTTAQAHRTADASPGVSPAGGVSSGGGGASPFRQRLLDALAESIAEQGYRATTVADVVRRARTSRRTFYEHFADKEACFIALLTDANADVIQRISEAVDPDAPPETQIQQAITAWIETADSRPALTLSWIRDSPTLGIKTRRLQRDLQEGFITLLQELTDTEQLRAAGIGPVSRQMAIVLLGGLRELIAVTVEDGGPMSDIRDAAVRASLALLAQPREDRLPPLPRGIQTILNITARSITLATILQRKRGTPGEWQRRVESRLILAAPPMSHHATRVTGHAMHQAGLPRSARTHHRSAFRAGTRRQGGSCP